jgi:hypothetical protein
MEGVGVSRNFINITGTSECKEFVNNVLDDQ